MTQVYSHGLRCFIQHKPSKVPIFVTPSDWVIFLSLLVQLALIFSFKMNLISEVNVARVIERRIVRFNHD